MTLAFLSLSRLVKEKVASLRPQELKKMARAIHTIINTNLDYNLYPQMKKGKASKYYPRSDNKNFQHSSNFTDLVIRT